MTSSYAVDNDKLLNYAPQELVKSRVDRRMIFYINTIFLLLPLEGILRKWLLNPIEQPFIFIRDPFMLLLIFEYYARYKGPKSILSSLWIVTTFVYTIVAALQFLLGSVSPIALIIGLRNYFFFFPLTFIIPAVFGENELKLWSKRWLMLSIPIGLLVILQFYSPVGSWVNRSISEKMTTLFLVTAGVVRPYGPFTFTLAQNVFAAMMFAVAVISFFKKKIWKVPLLKYIIPYILVFSMGALSGGRTYFIQVIVILSGVFVSGILQFNSKKGIKIIFGGVAVAATFLFVFVFVFSDSFGYMMERQQTAVAVEGSTSGRILDVATNFITAIPQAPIFGYGLGVGTNAGGYATTGARTFTLAEYELPRIILELGPIFGFLIVFIRLFLCAYLFTRSVKSLRRTGDASSIIFCSFAIPLMSFGSATGSNPMVTLTWFAAGIAFAFARVPAIAKRKHPVFAPNLPQTPHWRAQA